MKALFFITDGWVKVIDIENTLEAMQEAVGGYIETVKLTDDACLICNEEGMIRNLRPQTILRHTFFGNVLAVGVKGDEFTDVPESLITLFGGES